MDTMDRKYRPYYVVLSLAVMAFSVFVYWQKTHGSIVHKVAMIVPITIGCLIVSIWAQTGRESARLRFFILDKSLRGQGLGRFMVAEAMQFCRQKQYRRVFLTTLSGLDAAMQLYKEHGFMLMAEDEETFHGSKHVEQTLEWRAV